MFIYVGVSPNTDFVKGLVKMDKDGFIVTEQQLNTSAPGIFACGDCLVKPLRQIVTACGEAATSVRVVRDYIEEHGPYV